MKEEPVNSQFVSPQQFADRLSISRWTVYAWLQEGRIRSVKLGRLVRIPESEIARMVHEGTQEAIGR